MPICRKCKEAFPNRMKVDGVTRVVHNRKYCLTCSPFGLHNTRKLEDTMFSHRCGRCGETDATQFYGHKKSWCGACHNKYTLKKGQHNRGKMLAALGGKCVSCGFDAYACALDVHHLDPSKKAPSFAAARGWTWERIENEIRGCVLLCKNCHAAIHNGLIVLPTHGA